MDFASLLHWATSTNWAAGLILIMAALGALDGFLLASLAVSNFFFPNVTWDDNFVKLIHSWISRLPSKK